MVAGAVLFGVVLLGVSSSAGVLHARQDQLNGRYRSSEPAEGPAGGDVCGGAGFA